MIRKILPLFLILSIAWIGLSGCTSPTKGKKKEPAVPTMKDPSGDVSFQAFLGRLRQAVANRDASMLASMMPPNFGYSLNPDLEGAGVFAYWDEKGLWEELKLVVEGQWVPNGEFMVAPSQFATAPLFSGYRAGITRIGGSWKFAYFVNG